MSLVGITYQIGRSTYIATDERNLQLFEEDGNSESMKAFVNFITESGRTYKDKIETARRYRIFKSNYNKNAKHIEHEAHLPYHVTLNNQYADMTNEEFLQSVNVQASIVPQSVMERSGSNAFSPRAEYVSVVDRRDHSLPENLNW